MCPPAIRCGHKQQISCSENACHESGHNEVTLRPKHPCPARCAGPYSYLLQGPWPIPSHATPRFLRAVSRDLAFKRPRSRQRPHVWRHEVNKVVVRTAICSAARSRCLPCAPGLISAAESIVLMCTPDPRPIQARACDAATRRSRLHVPKHFLPQVWCVDNGIARYLIARTTLPIARHITTASWRAALMTRRIRLSSLRGRHGTRKSRFQLADDFGDNSYNIDTYPYS